MNRFSFSSLRVRLLLLIVIAITPVFGLMLHTASEERRHFAVEAQQNLLRMVRLIASNQARHIEGARQLLATLARLPEVRNHDIAGCSALFATLLKQYPRYANLGLVEPDGDVFCSALPFPKPVNVADSAWFRQVVQNPGFAIDEYHIDHIAGKPTVNLGYSLFDETGRVQTVVFASLSLIWLNQLAAKTSLPKGTVLTVIDQDGVILVRHPDPEKWVGQTVLEVPCASS